MKYDTIFYMYQNYYLDTAPLIQKDFVFCFLMQILAILAFTYEAVWKFCIYIKVNYCSAGYFMIFLTKIEIWGHSTTMRTIGGGGGQLNVHECPW